MSGEDHVGQLARGTHPYFYRSGEWATIRAVVPARGRDCWLVEFPDERKGVKIDLWPVEDPVAGYEFAAEPTEEAR